MALHRDIYWVGRQWAATGFGVQAIDQRLQGAFDIESSRLWDDGLQARMRRYAWLNGEDFDKALMIARQRFPAPAEKELSLVESVLELIRQPASAKETADEEEHRRHCEHGMMHTHSGCAPARRRSPVGIGAIPPDLQRYYRNYQTRGF